MYYNSLYILDTVSRRWTHVSSSSSPQNQTVAPAHGHTNSSGTDSPSAATPESIDQALAGIDKLLKSQELTFAFVGVAPALALVYLAGGGLRAALRGGFGAGRYGGRRLLMQLIRFRAQNHRL